MYEFVYVRVGLLILNLMNTEVFDAHVSRVTEELEWDSLKKYLQGHIYMFEDHVHVYVCFSSWLVNKHICKFELELGSFSRSRAAFYWFSIDENDMYVFIYLNNS